MNLDNIMNLDTLDEVVLFCKNINKYTYKQIYNIFNSNAENYKNSILKKQFNNSDGFGELSFSWHWYLLVNEMPSTFKFLEIGVYKGRVLSLIQLLSNLLKKNVQIWGITPLSSNGDKFSKYEDMDYLNEIKTSFINSNVSFENTKIIKGFSQQNDIINKAKENMYYDIIFIDGCHDYHVVCLDIKNYSKMLKSGGYLVLDNASLYLQNAYGTFLGHADVGKAIIDHLDNNPEFTHLYAVGHNRAWRKN
jgi:hypothetical protein